jgi:FkbM family methyltransferase
MRNFFLRTRLKITRLICRPLPPIIAQRLRSWIFPTEKALTARLPVRERSLFGPFLESDIHDVHGFIFAVHGYCDWRVQAVAAAVIREGDTVIEIGANIGTETIVHAALTGARGRVLVFEPYPPVLKELIRNVEINHFPHVTVSAEAVGETTGTVTFRSTHRDSFSGLSHIVTQPVESGDASITRIECTSLNDIASRVESARAVFVDVEGGEGLVLRGGGEFLKRFKPVFVLEVISRHLKKNNDTPATLFGLLTAFGYTCYKINRLGLSRVTGAGLDEDVNTNWVCIPGDGSRLAGHIDSVLRRAGTMPCMRGLNPLVRG